MAVQTRHLRPLWQARIRRAILPRYFRLSGKAFFLLIVLAASLLALLALAQTGRVVAVAWQLRRLQQDRQELLWQREALLRQIAEAVHPAQVERWALEHGMEPMGPEDQVFIPMAPERLSQGNRSEPALAVQP
ncbi:MAG: hypothetical protein ACP5OO_01840 [Chloroflexia bacterium]